MNYLYKVNKSPRFHTLLALLLIISVFACKSGQNVNVRLNPDGSADINISSGKKGKGGGKPKSPKPASPKAEQAGPKASKVISTARTYLGAPYKLGGTTKAGIDCSGLMLVSFRAAGIELPRTSREQSTQGKSVALTDLAPGDMVFMTDKKGGKTVTHVGLVTVVNNAKDVKFIHASTHLGVVETDLFTTYYTPLILSAKRMW